MIDDRINRFVSLEFLKIASRLSSESYWFNLRINNVNDISWVLSYIIDSYDSFLLLIISSVHGSYKVHILSNKSYYIYIDWFKSIFDWKNHLISHVFFLITTSLSNELCQFDLLIQSMMRVHLNYSFNWKIIFIVEFIWDAQKNSLIFQVIDDYVIGYFIWLIFFLIVSSHQMTILDEITQVIILHLAMYIFYILFKWFILVKHYLPCWNSYEMWPRIYFWVKWLMIIKSINTYHVGIFFCHRLH